MTPGREGLSRPFNRPGRVLADALGTATTLAVIAAGFGLVAVGMLTSPVRNARYADVVRT